MHKQALARYDAGNGGGSVLLCTSMLPAGKRPRTGERASENLATANVRAFENADWPALTGDDQDLTP